MSCGCGGQLPINQATLGDRLWRALNLRGSQQTPGQLTPSVDTSVKLLDLTAPEYAWLSREKRFAGTGIASAVAAQNSQVEFRNNAGSGLIMVVDSIEILTGAATGFGLFLSTVTNLGLSQSQRTQALDARQEEGGILSTPSPQGLIFFGASAFAIPSASWFMTMTGLGHYVLPCVPIVLKPGTYLRMLNGTTNVSLEVRLRWRERAPSPSELQ